MCIKSNLKDRKSNLWSLEVISICVKNCSPTTQTAISNEAASWVQWKPTYREPGDYEPAGWKNGLLVSTL